MKTTIKLAVASALLAAASSASAAGGIVAGDWTLDIGGNVNAFYTSTSRTGDNKPAAGTDSSVSNITTGLLPNFLSVSGKTRQNDLDVAFTISLQPGSAVASSGTLGNNNNRQAFVTFGDKSWGSIKAGKDLGIFASDAILSDMTLLGVGQGAAAVGNTTLGRIGAGYMYADWKSQIAYTSPNFNGFSFTAGVTQSWNALDGSATDVITSNTATNRGGSAPAFEGKASYEWAGDVAGKVWVSALSQKVDFTSATIGNDRATAWDIGAKVDVAGFGLVGYYGNGNGIGQTFLLQDGFDAQGKSRDSDDWYVQGTYVVPGVGTKLGVSYGESNLDANSAEKTVWKDKSVQMWTVGAYHPLTKHLNLVAEYSDVKNELNSSVVANDTNGKSKTISLGAILFF
ncbi:MAG: porin [Methylotenera sp.]|nr:porin [Methylotenera sp.]MDD4926091.1 porin [Methylotenera sp.]